MNISSMTRFGRARQIIDRWTGVQCVHLALNCFRMHLNSHQFCRILVPSAVSKQLSEIIIFMPKPFIKYKYYFSLFFLCVLLSHSVILWKSQWFAWNENDGGKNVGWRFCENGWKKMWHRRRQRRQRGTIPVINSVVFDERELNK